MNALEYLDRLSVGLAQLPGIGRRSADRMAQRLAGQPDGLIRELIQSMQEVAANVRLCERCGGITTVEEGVCRLCRNTGRDGAVLCVVEQPSDVIALERSGGFSGRYHVLMGKLSPMHGEGPADLRVANLLRRVETERFQEVVLALGTDVESDATASYLAEVLKPYAARVTRLATGLPAGSGIPYSDPVTLARALKGRREM